ncbi:MAG: hypothetical protein GX221_05530 [Candidatus Riflebacteria bacterium]|nr:hypothetical protein [Candidatus Riflebacteria bacterium]
MKKTLIILLALIFLPGKVAFAGKQSLNTGEVIHTDFLDPLEALEAELEKGDKDFEALLNEFDEKSEEYGLAPKEEIVEPVLEEPLIPLEPVIPSDPSLQTDFSNPSEPSVPEFSAPQIDSPANSDSEFHVTEPFVQEVSSYTQKVAEPVLPVVSETNLSSAEIEKPAETVKPLKPESPELALQNDFSEQQSIENPLSSEEDGSQLEISGFLIPQKKAISRRRYYYAWYLKKDDGQLIALKPNLVLMSTVKARVLLDSRVKIAGDFADKTEKDTEAYFIAKEIRADIKAAQFSGESAADSEE